MFFCASVFLIWLALEIDGRPWQKPVIILMKNSKSSKAICTKRWLNEVGYPLK